MKRRFALLKREQRGQALTEFALAAPLLLLLVFGIFDAGRYFYGHMQLQLAAQETVRQAGFGSTDAELRTFAAGYLGVSDSAAIEVKVVPGDGLRDSGDYVTVTLETPFSFLTPVASIVPEDFTSIAAVSTIRVE
ncbi:pilus assembly protein [Paenibacillus sp. TRM 82003]|nr:pilus assembly protein [Paenibacillus sp. TRM 82003]